jgi:hypothetical protein
MQGIRSMLPMLPIPPMLVEDITELPCLLKGGGEFISSQYMFRVCGVKVSSTYLSSVWRQ